MKRWRFMVNLLCTIGLLFPLLVQPALNQRVAVLAQSDDEEPNPMVTSYAETFGISYAEAERRLLLQEEMSALEQKVREGEPTYARSWTQHQPDFRLIVAFASSDGDKLIRKYLEGVLWADLVEVRQSSFTVGELKHILNQVVLSARETNIPFESGTNFQTDKVKLYTPQVEELRSQLETKEAIRGYLDDIEYIYRESLSAPAQLKYPYLLGGEKVREILTCTTGFTVKRNSDNRRFMSTAGHCDNALDVEYNNIRSVYLGSQVFDNDPYNDPPGSNNNVDLQVHDVSVRSLDLTNVIRTNTTTTASVISRELKASTFNDWVCKYGRSTALTCGLVTDITFSPSYAPGDRFVLVDNYALISDIGCGGDSGGPIFKSVTGGVSALGIFSGVAAPSDCNGSHRYFFYSPVDEIENVGFGILTSHYQQRYHLMVWSGASCTEYITPIDDNGKFLYAQQTTQVCSTSLPTGSSGTVQSYNAYVVGQYWREGMWRGGVGYVRKVSLNNNGTVNWGGAPAWSVCCGGQTAPRAQEGKIVGNHIYLNVFESNGGCTEHKAPINNSGDPNWAAETTAPCRTTAPGGGAVQSYNMYVLAENWREGIWQSNLGYTRTVALNNTNTDINYGGAPSWVSCCNGITPPDSQGGDILTYP